VPQYSIERRAGMLDIAVLIQATMGCKMQQMFFFFPFFPSSSLFFFSPFEVTARYLKKKPDS